MTRPLRLVAVSGGLQRPSRTGALVEHLAAEIATRLPVATHVVHLGDVAPGLACSLDRRQLPADVEAHLSAIESADALIVASPVYRASYSGLFKHFFDFVGQDALVDVPVLLAATGGSDRHALVLDTALRPLFSFFQALTLPIGVYASPGDFDDYRVTSAPLQARIALAVERALPHLKPRTVAMERVAA
jgi:FMN reductase